MSEPRTPDAEPEPELEPDFADEHSSPTFADDQEGGPEGMEEPESPSGYAGSDPD